ncbi:hypothetical protein Hanom_Chr05g00471241 [Helianthus anomalus]
MSSLWDDNYFFGQYSNESWVPETDLDESGVSSSNEEGYVVSDVHANENRLFLDLNKPPRVDETYYVKLDPLILR